MHGELRVKSQHESVRVGYFDGISDLVAGIQRSNPAVEVTGYWPPVTK